jgi:basic membrane protein A
MAVAALASCKKDDDSSNTPTTKLKIGLVSAEGGFGDNGYNDLALAGLNKAGADLGVTTESYDCADTNDIKSGINYFVQNNFDVIFCLSYGARYSVLQAAQANPTKKFILLDDTISNPPSNVKCFVYQVDQASFLCGFLGAYWAEKKDPANPICSWVGGIQIPAIEQFKTGYLSGIAYYNSNYNRNVIADGTTANGSCILHTANRRGSNCRKLGYARKVPIRIRAKYHRLLAPGFETAAVLYNDVIALPYHHTRKIRYGNTVKT